MSERHRFRFSTTQIIAYGFLGAIIVGTLLLSLPLSWTEGTKVSVLDALFTATTSVCVTGLTTVTIVDSFNTFGQMVIMILIQVGGLGIITFTTLILLFFRRRVTLKERMLIQDAYNLNTLTGLIKLTKRILKGTLIIEGIGAILFCYKTIPRYGFLRGVFKAVFLSVSAFCNAGIDLFGSNSLMDYKNSILINFTIMFLIIVGGIGFPVWWNIIDSVERNIKNRRDIKRFFRCLSLHTKLAILGTIIFLVINTLAVFALEYKNPGSIGSMSFGRKLMASMFQAVTNRTAGFATIPQEQISADTTFINLLFMFIGGSPSGTAGGIKTVTVLVLFCSVISIIKGENDVIVFRRKINDDLIKKSLAVVSIGLSVVIISTTLLLLTQNGDFLDIIYEVISAFATVGLTRNYTGQLNAIGKLIIIITMYIGRIGPISMALAFNITKKKNANISMPEEDIYIG